MTAAGSLWGGECTREGLKSVVASYFQAMGAHDPARLPVAPNLRFTENSQEMKLGEGLWKGAGKLRFHRSLIDTGRCGSLTEAVMDENGGPVIAILRLKLDKGKISEVETIVARTGDFAFKPLGVLETTNLDWEGLLPPEQRATRETMNAAANAYYDMFAEHPAAESPFAFPCERWENGTYMTKKYCSPRGLVITHPHRRFPVTDVEAGVTAAIVHFAEALPDVHFFKIRNGKIELIEAVCAGRTKDTGWPDE